MKKQIKRSMALVLSIMLIISMMPINVFAEDSMMELGQETATEEMPEEEVNSDQPEAEEAPEEAQVAAQPEVEEAEPTEQAASNEAEVSPEDIQAAPEGDEETSVDENAESNSEDTAEVVTPASPETAETEDAGNIAEPSETDEATSEATPVEEEAEETAAKPEEAEEETEENEEDVQEVDPDRKFSYRLLVGFSGEPNTREGDVVLGEFDNVVLIGFDSATELSEAKVHYESVAAFASVDGEVKASADASASTDVDSVGASQNAEAASINENPISEAAEEKVNTVPGKVIALVDTGAAGSNVVKTLSVMGDNGADDNGHGTGLAKLISNENPNVKIISIKVLDANGRGSVASVYAGIKLASESGADIIVLPFSARGSSDAIESIVSYATSRGALVLAAAGNDSDDAAFYCPANTSSSIAVGALGADREPASFSNAGSTVRAWAEADSTSEAVAVVAAGVAGGKSIEDYALGMYYSDSEGTDEEAEEFEAAYKTTTDSLVDGGIYIIRLRKEPKRALVQQTGTLENGNKFVLSNGEKREDSGAQFKLKKINYNFYLQVRDNTNYIMSPEGGSGSLGTNGQKVHMWYKTSSNYADFDQWWMKKNGNYYRITNGKNTGMHLQTEGANTAGNTYTHLWNATSGEQGDWIFERCYYNVQFNPNGGSGSAYTQKFWQEESKALSANTFTRTGYTFSKWKNNSNNNTYSNKQTVSYLTSTNAATINLYAQWTANTYAVKYDGNGSTSGSTANSSHTYDTAKNLTANGYSKTGYTFNGWNTKADGTGTAYANSASVKNLTSTNGGTVTLYAQWTPITYTVAYNGNGNTSGSTASSTHTYDAAKNLTANGFVKTGYSFTGWNTNAAGTGTAYGAGAAVTNLRNSSGTFNLYAQWKANNYTLALDNQSATEAGTAAVYYVYDTPTYYKEEAHTTAITKITVPTRTGYVFGGYYSAKEGKGTQYITTDGAFTNDPYKLQGATLYAKWTPNTYSVSMDANGGNLNGSGINKTTDEKETATATFDEMFTLHNPVREGYEFKGWTISGMESGIQHEIGHNVSTEETAEEEKSTTFKNLRATSGTVSFVADWEVNAYTVRFDANGGSLAASTVNPLDISYDESFKVDAPTRAGHVFAGWKITGMEGTSHVIGGVPVSENSYTYYVENEDDQVEFKNLRAIEGEVEVTAVWADDKYKVKYDLAGGLHDDVSDGETKAHDYSNTYHLANPRRPGYKFAGWTISGMDAGTDHIVGGTTTTAAEITGIKGTSFGKLSAVGAGNKEGTEPVSMTATWTEDDITVALIATDADAASEYTTSINYTYTKDGYYKDAEHSETLASPIVLPVRENYSFTGYYENSDATGEAIIGTNGNIPEAFYNKYTSSINLYAGWDAEVYTITLNQEDATTPGSEAVYEKYNKGIYSDSAATEEVDAISIPKKDITVTFNANANAEVADPKAITKGSEFDGYYDGDTALIGAGGQLMSAFSATYFEEDGALDAKWKGATVALPTLKREGYTLDGWYTAATGGEKVGNGGENYVAEENVTLFAHWIPDPVLRYDGNGSTEGTTPDGAIAKGKTLTPAASGFEKSGYSFVGWNTEANGSGTVYEAGKGKTWNEDLPAGLDYYTLYAQWEKNEFEEIKAISDQKYTGSAITPAITLIDKTGKVVDSSEYELTWNENTNVGEATVTAVAKSDGNYSQSESVSATFKIVKAEAEYFDVNEKDYSGIYDGKNHAVKATAKTEDAGHAYKIGYGASEADAKAAAEAASEGTTNPGHNVKAVADTGVIYYYIIPKNYEAFGGTLNASITKKELSVSGLAAETRAYDGTKAATLDKSAAELVGVCEDDVVTLDDSNAMSEAASKNAGTHKVSVSGLEITGDDAANYTLAQPTDVTIEITKKVVRIEWQTETHVYNGNAKLFNNANVMDADIVTGDSVIIGSITGNVETNVGTYTAKVISLAEDDAANYSIDSETATCEWKIVKTTNDVTVDIKGWTYGKSANEPTCKATYGEENVVYTYSSDGGSTWVDAVPTNAGNHIVKATVPETENYDAASATKEFAIEPAKVSIVANDAQSVRGSELASNLGFEISGDLKESDRETLESLIEVTTNAEKDTAGWYDTTADWVDAANKDNNYDVTFKAGIYTVTRSDSKVVALGYSGKYDAEAHGISVSVTQPEGTPIDDSALIYYTDDENGFNDTVVEDLNALKTITEEEAYKTEYNKLQNDLSGYATDTQTLTNVGVKTVRFIVLSSQTNPDVIVGEKVINIMPADLTVTAKDKAVTYGDPAANDGVKYSGFVEGEDESVLSDILAYDYQGYIQGSDAGKYAITPSGLTADNDNYEITYKPGVLTVNPRKIELDWSDPIEFNYNGTERKVYATINNVYDTDSVFVAEYNNNAKTNVGEYTATATKLGGDKAANYTLSGTPGQAWKIQEMGNNVSITMEGWTYGDPSKEPVVTTEAGLGVDKVELTYYKDAMCTLPTDSSDGATASGGQPLNAGSYYVKAVLPTADEYAGSEAVATFTIAKRAIVIQADDKASTYGESMKPLTYQMNGSAAYNDDLKIELATEATSTSKAGNYEIRITHAENQNYDFEVTKGQYTITKAKMGVSAEGYVGDYDGKAHGITVTLDPSEEGKATVYYAAEELDSSNYTEGTTNPKAEEVTRKNAGTTTVYYYVDSEYYDGEPAIKGSVEIKINKISLTVKAEDSDIVYGDEAANGGVSFDGFIDGEDEGDLGGSAAYSISKNATSYAPGKTAGSVGEYDIIPSGFSSDNYDITYEAGTMTVNPLGVTFEWDENSFTYNGSPQGPEATVKNALSGDVVTVASYNGNEEAEVGAYVAQVSAIEGADASNYKLAPAEKTASHKWKIVKTDNDWTSEPKITGWTYGQYDETANAPSSTAKFGNDSVVYEYKKAGLLHTLDAYSTKVPTEAGDYILRATIPGTDNYRELSGNCEFTISKANITITADDKSSMYRSHIEELTATVTGDYVKGDELGITLETEATLLSSVGDYVTTVDWDKNPNYNATLVNGKYSITKGYLTIEAKNAEHEYDGEPHGIDVKVTKPHLHDATIWYATEEITPANFNTVEKTHNPLDESVAQVDAGTKTVYYYVVSENFAQNPSEGDALSGSKTVTVTQKDLEVTVLNQNIIYGDEPNAGAPSNLKDAISYHIPAGCSDDLDISGLKFAYDYDKYGDIGVYDIEASGIKSNNYKITYKKGKLNVGKFTTTFKWQNEKGDDSGFVYTYDGEEHSVAAVPQTINGDVIEGLTYDHNKATEAGIYTAKVTAMAETGKGINYTFDPAAPSSSEAWDIQQAVNVWTTEPEIEGWTYGEKANKYAAASKFGNDTMDVMYRPADSDDEEEWNANPPTRAGEYTMRVHVPGTNNYKELTANVPFTVEKAEITVTAADMESAYLEKIKNDPTAFIVEGDYVEGDELGIIMSCQDENGEDITPTSHVGIYDIDVVMTDEDALNNYDVTYVPGKYTITKNGLNYTDVGWEGFYDGQAHGTVVTIPEIEQEGAESPRVYFSLISFRELIGEEQIEDIEKDYSGDKVKELIALFDPSTEDEEGNPKEPGTLSDKVFSETPEFTHVADSSEVYCLILSENYHIYMDHCEVIIKKAPLTVQANDKTITFGDYPINDGVSYDGFVGEEDETVLKGELAYDIDYKQFGDVGEYKITPHGLEADDYEIEFIDGKLTVEPLKITKDMVNMTEVEFKYDGEAHKPEYEIKFTAKDENGEDVEYVLKEGRDFTVEGNKEESALGTYQLTFKGEGNFVGEVSEDWRISGETETETFDEGDGKIVIEKSIHGEDMSVKVSGFTQELAISLLTEAELARVREGEVAKVYLEISKVEVLDEEDKDPTFDLLKELGAEACAHLEIKIWKKVGDDSAVQIHDLGSREVTFTATVPEDYLNAPEGMERSFYVVRAHEGEAVVLTGPTGETEFTFSSSLFSGYTIAYKDTAVEKADTETSTDDAKADSKNGGRKSGAAPTGDETTMVPWGLTLVGALLAMYEVSRRRRNNSAR